VRVDVTTGISVQRGIVRRRIGAAVDITRLSSHNDHHVRSLLVSTPEQPKQTAASKTSSSAIAEGPRNAYRIVNISKLHSNLPGEYYLLEENK